MMSLTAVERSALVLAGTFLFTGTCAAIHPVEMYMAHTGTSRFDRQPKWAGEYISREDVRILGVLSMAVGIGIGWLALHRPRSPEGPDDDDPPPSGFDDPTPILRLPAIPQGPHDGTPRRKEDRLHEWVRSTPESWKDN